VQPSNNMHDGKLGDIFCTNWYSPQCLVHLFWMPSECVGFLCSIQQPFISSHSLKLPCWMLPSLPNTRHSVIAVPIASRWIPSRAHRWLFSVHQFHWATLRSLMQAFEPCLELIRGRLPFWVRMAGRGRSRSCSLHFLSCIEVQSSYFKKVNNYYYIGN